jgi:hypothetical protein
MDNPYNRISMTAARFWHTQAGFPCTGCGTSCALLTAATGTITDGSGAANYANNANCKWVISSGSGAGITLTSSQFNLENNADYLRVYMCMDSSCSAPELYARYTGTGSFNPTIPAPFVGLLFTSDGSIQNQGFSLTYSRDTPALPVRSIYVQHDICDYN